MYCSDILDLFGYEKSSRYSPTSYLPVSRYGGDESTSLQLNGERQTYQRDCENEKDPVQYL
jgi:hypothetical protein